MTGEQRPGRPVLQVIRGDAGAEEVAALLAVIAARTSASETRSEAAPRRVGSWSDPASRVGQPPHAGPGAWQAALRQR